MIYKLCRNPNAARTMDYAGTVTDLNDNELARIKDNIKRHNKEVREISRKYGRAIGHLWRVRVMPRGPRAEAAEHFRGYRRSYDSYLPMGLGESFDIYTGIDSSNQYELKRELETGMSPGELKRYDRLNAEADTIRFKALCRKRAQR